MKMMLVAAVLITLPAIAVVIFFLFAGRPTIVLPALASLAVNTLPFVVAGWLIHKRSKSGDHDGDLDPH